MPLISYEPLSLIVLLPYLYSYLGCYFFVSANDLDLSELNGGRPKQWLRELNIWRKAKGNFPLSGIVNFVIITLVVVKPFAGGFEDYFSEPLNYDLLDCEIVTTEYLRESSANLLILTL